MTNPDDNAEVQTYVVRVYRHGQDALPGILVGTVERVASGETLPFRDLTQLGTILLPPATPQSIGMGGGEWPPRESF
jgi:hypothetical protein